MMKALGLALLCVLVGCGQPDLTGGGKLTITKHQNGKTASRGYMLNDHIKVGDWVYFFEDGKDEKKGGYIEDQMHGTWTFWLPDGSESWTAEYEHGEGSKNGRLAEASAEIRGEIRDEWVRAVKEGGASDEYIPAMMQGVPLAHSGTRFYRLGLEHGPWKRLRENGEKESEGTYKNGKLDGAFILWHENGEKKAESTYSNGQQEGVATWWHENGQKSSEGTFKNEKKEGVWTYWNDKGNVTKTGTYKNGEMEGVWTEWHANGKKRSEGIYKGGEMEGVWTFWLANGKKWMEGTYTHSKEEGVWTRWDDKGNVTKTETYKNGVLVK